MLQLSEKIADKEIQSVLKKIKREWDFEKPADDDFLIKGISYYLAIRKIAEENKFDAISLKDVDGMKKILSFPPAMIFMLLSDEMKLCTIPENDAMGAVTQLIVKHITGQCAAYLEFYEFFEKSVLLGVPDFVPAEVVNGKVKVTPAAFGNISGGLLNISTLKTGKLTMARLSNTGDQYTMHICTGEGKLNPGKKQDGIILPRNCQVLKYFSIPLLKILHKKFPDNIISLHMGIIYRPS